MRAMALGLCLLLTANVLAEALPSRPQYVNSRAIILSFESANAASVDQVNLWVSTDNGETWKQTAAARTSTSTVRFDAPRDGKYSFYMVLHNEAGCSADAPSAGTKPHLTVTIDTAPPTVQIHQARQTTSPSGKRQLRLLVSLVEENLGEGTIRLFYRAHPDGAWQDGGPVIFADGIINWRPPADVGSELDLHIVVTDLAGNRASDEIRDVSLAPLLAYVSSSPAQPESSTAMPLEAGGEVTVPTVPPVTLDPLPPVTLGEQPVPTPRPQPSPESDKQSQLLRQQASRYLAQGRLSLAGARLHEALRLAPSDPDVLVELGNVLYRARQYDQAQRRFRNALDASPDHLGAIEGLALVAATQNRYPQARSYLQHLLRLSPQSGKNWLHYGDIEHVLGNAAEARAAWDKVLKLEPADNDLRDKAQKRLRLFGEKRGLVGEKRGNAE